VNEIIIKEGTEADFDFIADRYNDMPLSQEKLEGTSAFAAYLEKVNNLANVKKGIDMIIRFRMAVPEQYRGFVDPMLKGGLDKLAKVKGKEIENYVSSNWK
jgi:aminopeptidase N